MKAKNKMRWWQRTLLILGIILGVIVISWGGYMVGSRIGLNEFYSLKTDMRNNPGLNDGYIPQGTSYVADQDVFLTSGYMQDKSASRVYSIDKNNKSHYAKVLQSDGSDCTNHFGGVATIGNYVYVASGNSFSQLKLDDVLSQDKATIQQQIATDCKVSFIFANNISVNALGATAEVYVGEFHDGESYVCEHPYTTSDNETNHAIVIKYAFVEAAGLVTIVKEAVYSIRNEVQGFCVTASGSLVLSVSHGLSYSHFYVYDAPSLLKIDTLDGITPVYYLDSRYLKEDITGISMAEDLDYYDGKVLFCTESACNKYIYGKLFFYNQIYGLKID